MIAIHLKEVHQSEKILRSKDKNSGDLNITIGNGNKFHDGTAFGHNAHVHSPNSKNVEVYQNIGTNNVDIVNIAEQKPTIEKGKNNHLIPITIAGLLIIPSWWGLFNLLKIDNMWIISGVYAIIFFILLSLYLYFKTNKT